ncbi:alpha/beta hydrolase [Rhodococcus aetherivorans]
MQKSIRDGVDMRRFEVLTAAAILSASAFGWTASPVGAAPGLPAPTDLPVSAQPFGLARIVSTTAVADRQFNVVVHSPAMGKDITLRVIRPADPSVPRPTLYLLSGVDGASDARSWTTETDAVEFFSDKNANVVIPYGGASSYYTDWISDDPNLGRNKWTTFLTRELPSLVDAEFGSTGRHGLIGFSMSGTSSLNLAIAAPGLYEAVASFSGCAITSDPIGRAFVAATVVNFFGNPLNMWGPLDDPTWIANDPYVNAERLRGTKLYLSNGSGLPGRHDALESPWIEDEGELVNVVVEGGLIEAATNECTRRMAGRLDELGIPATVNLRPTGTHSWGYWQDELHASWPMFADALGA